MIVKEIEACDVLSHLEKGKSVALIDFGEKNFIKNAKVYDLTDCTIKSLLEVIKTPGNRFFEKIEEE